MDNAHSGKSRRGCNRPGNSFLPLILLSALTFQPLAWAQAAAGNSGYVAGHKLQVPSSVAIGDVEAEGGRLVADYGSFRLFQFGTVNALLESQLLVENRDDFNLIRLNTGAIDTSRAEVQAARASVGTFPGKRLHLVQFAGPILPAWREELEQLGVQVVVYIPENAYLVYGDATALGKLQQRAVTADYIQWEAAYLDDYKINPSARLTDANGNARNVGTDVFSIQLLKDEAANVNSLRLIDQLKLAPVLKQHEVLGYLNVLARVAPENLPLLATQPELISIQPYFPPHKLCERQDQIIAGNLLGNVPSGPGYLNWLTNKGFTQLQFTTSGFAVDVSDSGLDDGTTQPHHPGLFVSGNPANASRVVYNRLEGTPNSGSTLSGCDGHGTLNNHIIGGYEDQAPGFPHTDSAGYHYGLGVCPFVRLGSSVIFDPDFFTFPDYSHLQSNAYNNGVRISSNSWGGGDGLYDADAQEYDALVRDAEPAGTPHATAGNQEMVIVFAAGNDGDAGTHTIGSPATAKNVISVGAGENVQAFGGADASGVTDAEADSANDLISFSSRGPCDDGRKKPDLTAPGTHVSGGVAQAANPGSLGTADSCFTGDGVSGGPQNSLFFPLNQAFYTASSGTSHACPCVAGGCALLRQFFINNGLKAPSPAMTKAYLMNSTRYMTGAFVNDTLWSVNQGMGEMNLGTAFDGVARLLRDEDTNDLFTSSGQTRVFTAVVANSSKPVRVTLAWTDAPGSTTGNAFNNNLDLVVVANGFTYRGNVFSGSLSIGGGSGDTRNNVENVFLPAGITNVTITVSAVNINSDGVPNNGISLDQDFALVGYNLSLGGAPTISQQPASQTVFAGQPAAFSVTAAGTSPLSYQWMFNGASLTAATNSTYGIASAQISNAGPYSVMISNSFGAITSATAVLSVTPTFPLPFALNNSNLTWTTAATNFWYGETNIAHDGIAAAQSSPIGNNRAAMLSTTVTGPGTLNFWWRVSSQAGHDFLSLSNNGSALASISGAIDWQQQTFYLSSGAQSLVWTYAKDTNSSSGSDAAWLDQVTYTSGNTAPVILSQPQNVSVFAGISAAFKVVASGTPPLSYQWRKDGKDLSGASASSFLLASPQTADGGAYSVVVSNIAGVTVSSNALLGIISIAGAGDDSLGQTEVPATAANAVALAAGGWHNLALLANERVVAWGDNYDGQCNVPANLSNVVAIAAGDYHSLALKLDRTVAAWGGNEFGQSSPPPGLSNVVALAAGAWHSLALRADGQVVAWGDNTWGQSQVPSGLGSVIGIAARGNHNLALKANGSVVAWGQNYGSDGTYVGQSVTPQNLLASAVSAGDYVSMAIKTDGTLSLWGDNALGELAAPANLLPVEALAGGGLHTVALEASGQAVAWGDDSSGQCELPAFTNVVAIAAGSAHTLVLVGNRSSAPTLLHAARSRSEFRVVVQTLPGKFYTLEASSNLSSTNWATVATVFGNGGRQFLLDPDATAPQRFYRVRQH